MSCRHEDFIVDRLELLFAPGPRGHAYIVDELEQDLAVISPETQLVRHPIELDDPWEFEEVYAGLLDFARGYRVRSGRRGLPRPHHHRHPRRADLPVPADRVALAAGPPAPELAARARASAGRARAPCGSSISTCRATTRSPRASPRARPATSRSSSRASRPATPAFNDLIEQIEQVALASRAPILLTGPTGAGKTQLARRIYELKRTSDSSSPAASSRSTARRCAATARCRRCSATRRARSPAPSTSAAGCSARPTAGMLFLDEIGELGLDEQAMLLRAIEDKRFLPVGSEREVESDFQLIAGTNRDLRGRGPRRPVPRGPARAHQPVDLRAARPCASGPRTSSPTSTTSSSAGPRAAAPRVTFNKRGARSASSRSPRSPAATWRGNFRDLAAAIERAWPRSRPGPASTSRSSSASSMRLRRQWAPAERRRSDDLLTRVLGPERRRRDRPLRSRPARRGRQRVPGQRDPRGRRPRAVRRVAGPAKQQQRRATGCASTWPSSGSASRRSSRPRPRIDRIDARPVIGGRSPGGGAARAVRGR